MLVVSALITVEAIPRLIHPATVAGGAVLAVAILGMVVNVVAAVTLAKANRSSLNVEGAYKHILTDLYGFIGTIVAAIIIIVTGLGSGRRSRLAAGGGADAAGRVRPAARLRTDLFEAAPAAWIWRISEPTCSRPNTSSTSTICTCGP